MAIKIIDGFRVNSPVPLDEDSIKQNLTEALLIPQIRRYIGKTVYLKDERKLYRWADGITDANLIVDNLESSRIIVNSINDMQNVINPHNGLECFVIDTEETYVYANGSWNKNTNEDDNLIWGSDIQI
jgi:hypothetical protein